MSTLDTRQLRMFLAVADCLNFRQAAEQLHLSQPPLSRAVKALEARLDVALFQRNTHQVSLTPAGAALVPHARRILAQLAEAERALRRHAAPPVLRLGLTSSLGPGLFTGFVEGLAARLPHLSLDITHDTSPRLIARLKKGRLHGALVALPAPLQGLSAQALAWWPQQVALSTQHPLARRRRLSFQDLARERIYWFERARQTAFFDHCQRVFHAHGFAPRWLPEPQDHHVLLAEVAAGRGLALLPASFSALRLRGVAYRPLREGAEIAVGLGWVQATPGTAAQAALDTARQLAASHWRIAR